MMSAESNSEKSVSCQKKDGHSHACPSFFWYDNDKNFKVCFLMTRVTFQLVSESVLGYRNLFGLDSMCQSMYYARVLTVVPLWPKFMCMQHSVELWFLFQGSDVFWQSADYFHARMLLFLFSLSHMILVSVPLGLFWNSLSIPNILLVGIWNISQASLKPFIISELCKWRQV